VNHRFFGAPLALMLTALSLSLNQCSRTSGGQPRPNGPGAAGSSVGSGAGSAAGSSAGSAAASSAGSAGGDTSAQNTGGLGGGMDELPNEHAPVEVSNPDLSDVCSSEGKRTGILNGVCPLHAGNWEWDESAGLYATTPEQSSVPACPLAEESDLAGLPAPGWRLKVDRDLGVFPAGESKDHFQSVFVVTRVDAPEPCALRMVWKLKQQALKLPLGTVIRYVSALSVRSVEDDVSMTSVVRDEAGKLLIGHAAGVRAEVWNKEVWPELSLKIEEPPICRDSERSQVELLRFTVSAGEDRCTLEARSARCCQLAAETYTVKASDAVRNSAKTVRVGDRTVALDVVNLIVARTSVLARAP
jgi:hypothetical protein